MLGLIIFLIAGIVIGSLVTSGILTLDSITEFANPVDLSNTGEAVRITVGDSSYSLDQIKDSVSGDQ
jgi:hypothetical protein